MTDEEIKQLLEKNLEISQENLKILRKINRARVIGNIYTFLKWLIIIGASIGIYYYIQPYLGKLTDLLKQLQEMQNIIPKNLMPR